MPEAIPLGQKENERLEFKARASLETPEDIAREVVAMLNAEGGEVWIGLREEGGRAVAVDPVPDPDRELGRLQDYLIDTMEPPPDSSEVELQRLDEESGSVLRIRMKPQEERRPYSFLRRGGRHFVIRVGARLRTMTREEIAERFSRSGSRSDTSHLHEVFGKLNSRLENLQKAGRGGFLWLGLLPAVPEPLQLDFQRVEESDLLIDPAKTGNRRVGSNFTAAYTLGRRLPAHHKDPQGGYLLVGKEDVFWLKVYRRGIIELEIPLVSLWKGGQERALDPGILMEYIVSIFRLAGVLYGDRGFWTKEIPASTLVVAQLVILGLEGWSLPKALQPEWPFLKERKREVYREHDLVLDRPAVFDLSEIREEPDLCGYRLVEQVYEAFNLSWKDIPLFDRKTGRLVLPE